MEFPNALKLNFFRKDVFFITSAMLVAFLLKTYYAFHYASFQDSVNNDMASYFMGAFRNIWGTENSFEQYAIFPPFYIYFLGIFVKTAFSLGFSTYTLQLTILFNIAIYCLSSYFVFAMVMRLAGNRLAAGLAQLFYLFSFTAMNINVLVLPDNLATPLMLIVTAMVVLYEHRPRTLFLMGLLLGIAIAAKPILAVFAPIFLWRVTKKGVMIFFLGLCLVPVLTIVKNHQISHGKLSGLGVNGGVNFFQGWGEVKKINSHSSDGSYWVDSPGAREELDWPEITTDEPFYHQSYYYLRGISAIFKNPSVLVRKIFWMKKLFFGDIGPFTPKLPTPHPKFTYTVNIILYLMFVIGLGFMPLIKKNLPIKDLSFFIALLACFFLSVYMMGMPERRYLFYMEYLIIILFFTAISRVAFLYQMIKQDVQRTALCMIAIFVCLPLTIHAINRFTGY